jgi:hypothetical protein
MINYYQNLDDGSSGKSKSEKANSEQSEVVPRRGDTSTPGEELAGKTTDLIY